MSAFNVQHQIVWQCLPTNLAPVSSILLDLFLLFCNAKNRSGSVSWETFPFLIADPEDPPKALDSSRQLAIKARNASRILQALSSEDRGKLLHQIADAIESHQDMIMAENEKDCQARHTLFALDSLNKNSASFVLCLWD